MRQKRIPVSRNTLHLAAIAVTIVAGAWWLVGAGDRAKDADWVRIDKDDLVLGVEVTGILKAEESSLLGPPESSDSNDYKISSLAGEGTEVKKGDAVLGFDTSELERKLQEKLAESEAARKKIEQKEQDAVLRRRQDELALAEAEAKRRKAALKVELPPDLSAASELWKAKLELEEAEKKIVFLRGSMAATEKADAAALGALRNQRDGAERRVREIREAIDRMTVRAPRDGTVVYVSNWREEKKKVGDSVWQHDKVLEIPDLRKMVAKGEVDEADAGRLAVGQKVSFRLDAHPDWDLTGVVASIWSTVQTRSWRDPLKVIRLDIRLHETDTTRMRPGMRFRGTIETGRIPGVVAIPAEAVFPMAAGPVAYRKTLLGYKPVLLKLGRRNEKKVEVLEGLREGDRVARRNLDAAKRRET